MRGRAATLPPQANYALALVCGAAFATAIYPLTGLEPRWMFAAIAGLVVVSTSLVFVSRLTDVLTAALFCAMPIAGFTKNYFPPFVADEDKGNVFFAGTASVGAVDLIVLGLFVLWAARRFAHREAPSRRAGLTGLDWVILAVIGAHVLSLLHAPVALLGILAVAYLVKQSLVYVYLSRNMRAKHVEWFLTMVAVMIVVQTALGAVQTMTGGDLIGLGRDKGAGGDELGTQYAVAKIEDVSRAEGTLMDSHELGAMFAMLLPFALAIVVAPEVKRSYRIVAALVFGIGVFGIGLTFSRSAIAGLATGLLFFAFVYLWNWPSRFRVPAFLMLIAGLALAGLVAVPVIGARYGSQSIGDAMDLRFEQYALAMRVWLMSPIIGYGAGNYMQAAKLYGNEFTELLPVHNMSLWILADTGVIGAIAFHGLFIAALRRYWRLLRMRAGLLSFTGLVACFVDNLTDPSLRGSTIFIIFWMFVALSASLPGLVADRDVVGRHLLRA